MAKQFSYTSDSGAVYPTSYWKLIRIYVDAFHKTINFEFNGYVDSTCRQKLLQSIGSMSFYVNEDNFASAISTDLLENGYKMATDAGLFPNGIDV